MDDANARLVGQYAGLLKRRPYGVLPLFEVLDRTMLALPLGNWGPRTVLGSLAHEVYNARPRGTLLHLNDQY